MKIIPIAISFILSFIGCDDRNHTETTVTNVGSWDVKGFYALPLHIKLKKQMPTKDVLNISIDTSYYIYDGDNGDTLPTFEMTGPRSMKVTYLNISDSFIRPMRYGPVIPLDSFNKYYKPILDSMVKEN